MRHFVFQLLISHSKGESFGDRLESVYNLDKFVAWSNKLLVFILKRKTTRVTAKSWFMYSCA